MKPLEAFTDFGSVVLPGEENALSRRYLDAMTRWIPTGMAAFKEWPGRRRCGHFFGGVLWYGQETAMPMLTLAAIASSSEFDADLAGRSREEIRETALMALRYLCFTHDTGPGDCVRPETSWGRPEPAGTKWGELGRGFFPESQCGRTIADLALAAALLRDKLGDEERSMLADIASDYLDRFGDMAPKAGVYNNTQTEENAWTALGLTACLMLLPGHERWQDCWEQTKLWMFRTSTMPRDLGDHSIFADGKAVRELCGGCFTTLPDGTAENHGFVHPSYMASALVLSGMALNVMRLSGHTPPSHIFWHRRECYDTLKSWCDATGAPQSVQGMDWPYFSYCGGCLFHAVANVHLGDPDAALLERLTLDVVEKSAAAHGGRMVPEEAVKYCHGQQDPAVMRERLAARLAYAYLVHRLDGLGETPSEPADFERRIQGIRVYHHGGAWVHRHSKGLTSFSWRNRTMLLPVTREGQKVIGPAAGSMLATVRVKGKANSTLPLALVVREGTDRIATLLMQDLAEASVRRQLFAASLPDGKCLAFERLLALDDITVERVEQGRLSIINDGYFGDYADLRGRRQVYWESGARTFRGYASDSDADDETLHLTGSGWVNVDDCFGLVFRGTGRAAYRNRHWFQPWRAVEDELTLGLCDKPGDFRTGDEVAHLVSLWCPEQSHDETCGEELLVHATPEGVFAATVGEFVCICNFTDEAVDLPGLLECPAGASFSLSRGVSGAVETDLGTVLRAAPREPIVIQMG